jgi:D-serine deaminase-like pyridoxal phosphate-dependent protein
MRLADLPTPSLILDRRKLAANLAMMGEQVRRHPGVGFRPHLKTAKSAEVARLAVAGHAGGITVSTVAEAEYFADHGFRDLLYAVTVVPAKLPRLAALMRRTGAEIMLLVDSVEAARAVAEAGETLGTGFAALIEIDTGEHRAGVAPDSPALVEIGRALHRPPFASLRGVMTHAGHSYACRSPAAIAEVAEAERVGAVRAAERLRAAGLPAPVVSVGSTPTALHARRLDGVTEVRAGVYMFGDMFQSAIGSCAVDDLAVSVLASVTGHNRETGHLLIDSGGLALSKDRSTADVPPHDVGFGLVIREDGTRFPDGDLVVTRAYQEHGVVRSTGTGGSPIPFDQLPIGARVRVLPNHVCMTAAMYDRYHVVDGGTDLVAEWTRVNGW